MWGIAITIWLISGIGCALIASSKNMNVGGWFFAGVLLGPLGILIIGFMKEEERDEVVRRNEMEEIRFRCPSCAEMVLVQAKVCRYCGRDLPGGRELPEDVKPRIPKTKLDKDDV